MKQQKKFFKMISAGMLLFFISALKLYSMDISLDNHLRVPVGTPSRGANKGDVTLGEHSIIRQVLKELDARNKRKSNGSKVTETEVIKTFVLETLRKKTVEMPKAIQETLLKLDNNGTIKKWINDLSIMKVKDMTKKLSEKGVYNVAGHWALRDGYVYIDKDILTDGLFLVGDNIYNEDTSKKIKAIVGTKNQGVRIITVVNQTRVPNATFVYSADGIKILYEEMFELILARVFAYNREMTFDQMADWLDSKGSRKEVKEFLDMNHEIAFKLANPGVKARISTFFANLRGHEDVIQDTNDILELEKQIDGFQTKKIELDILRTIITRIDYKHLSYEREKYENDKEFFDAVVDNMCREHVLNFSEKADLREKIWDLYNGYFSISRKITSPNDIKEVIGLINKDIVYSGWKIARISQQINALLRPVRGAGNFADVIKNVSLTSI